MTSLETLTFAAAITETDTRTFSGTAVNYGEKTRDNRDPSVQFAAGSFGDAALHGDLPLVALYVEHDDTKTRVGRVESWLDSDAALTFTARLNTTPEADAVYQALKDGDLSQVSVRVMPIEFTADDDGAITYTYVELHELSLTADAAFSGSTVLSVFSAQPNDEATAESVNPIKETPMENELNPEVAALTERLDALDETIAQGFSAQSHTSNAVPFSSLGEYVQAFASGDSKAIEFAKVAQDFAANGTTSDSVLRNGWTNDVIRLIEKPRKIINAFSTSPLPAEGMNVESGVLDTNSLQVAIQATEFAQIVKGNISVDSAYTPVKTFAGGADVSRQAVERQSISYLELNWTGMALAYAAATEAYVRTQYLAAGGTSVTANFNNADAVTGFLLDAGAALEDQGLTADVAVMTRDKAKQLATLRIGTTGDYFLNRSQGSINLLSANGDLAGVPFVIIPGTGHFSVASKLSLRTFENGGPFRLQQDDVNHLSQTLALYGYLATHVQIPNGIVKHVQG
jgi:HK97 family phage prohead protease